MKTKLAYIWLTIVCLGLGKFFYDLGWLIHRIDPHILPTIMLVIGFALATVGSIIHLVSRTTK